MSGCNLPIQHIFPSLCHLCHFFDIFNVIVFRGTNMIVTMGPVGFNVIRRDMDLLMMFGHLPPMPMFPWPQHNQLTYHCLKQPSMQILLLQYHQFSSKTIFLTIPSNTTFAGTHTIFGQLSQPQALCQGSVPFYPRGIIQQHQTLCQTLVDAIPLVMVVTPSLKRCPMPDAVPAVSYC